MKIVVMSDSHAYDEEVRNVCRAVPDADYYLHLGDLCSDKENFDRLIMVRGNNDWDFDLPRDRVVNYNGLRIYMTHSHMLAGRNFYTDLAKKAIENDCQIALFGHTHVPCDMEKEGIRLINPGSLYYNRDGSEKVFVTIEITDKNNYEVKWHKLYNKTR